MPLAWAGFCYRLLLRGQTRFAGNTSVLDQPMTTNFALSLSFEGIELFHRVTSGWQRVGSADIEADDLGPALATLREKALALEPTGLRTKLVIPYSQIKYIALDTTQTNFDDIHAALDGLTPYDLDDLVIDYERSGGRTHVAAVARETLQEAESFALAHQFNPVCFVAVPDPFTFQKEVFFGATAAAGQFLRAQDVVARDQLPVLEVGARVESRILATDDTQTALIDASAPHTVDTHSTTITDAPTLWIDRIVPEFHAPVAIAVIAQAPVPRAPVIAQNPVLADLSGMNRIIAEYHPDATKPARPALSALSPDVRAVIPAVGVGVAPVRNQPAPANASRRPLIVAGAIAASVVVAGALAWTQLGGTSTTALPPETVAQETGAPLTPETVRVNDLSPIVASTVSQLVAPRATPLAVSLAPIEVFAATVAPAVLPTITADGAPSVYKTTPPAPTQTNLAARGLVLSPAQAQEAYEATGVWQRAARFVDIPSADQAMNLTRPAPLPAPKSIAQPELPLISDITPDLSFLAPAVPPSADAVFDLDANGNVVATDEGAITPEGAVVYAGLPDINIRLRPELSQEDRDRMALLSPAPEGVIVIAGRPDVVPPTRPEDVALAAAAAEAQGTPTPGAVGLDALTPATQSLFESTAPEGVLRPRARPDALVQAAPASPAPDSDIPDITAILEGVIAEGAAQDFVAPTDQAVATSVRPTARPRNFDRVVTAARERQATQPAPAAAAVAPAAAAAVAPQNYAPVPGGVARAATQEDEIRLREINLIGTYGRGNSPRALVRLANGRYEHVEVGSSLDGGQVTAIGNGILNYVKRGRTIVLEIVGN